MKKLLYVISVLGVMMLGVIGLSPIIEEMIENRRVFPFLVADVILTSETDEWEPLYFDHEPYLEVANPLFKREITNHANNENDIEIRVKDINHNLIVENMVVSPGTSAVLKGLKLNEQYIIEVRAVQGRYFIVMS
ncbi:MAG: hypothetical protein IJ085_05540, partial [Turicibacter sp.]|nr:hypothetical protein [Turicibacter sp.]